MKNVSLFAFNGDLMCFAHVLLNALDMKERGYLVRIVIEGSATKLLAVLNMPSNPFHKLYTQVKQEGLIDCVCRACAAKMGAMETVKIQELELCDEMEGHPSMARYMEEGFEVITF